MRDVQETQCSPGLCVLPQRLGMFNWTSHDSMSALAAGAEAVRTARQCLRNIAVESLKSGWIPEWDLAGGLPLGVSCSSVSQGQLALSGRVFHAPSCSLGLFTLMFRRFWALAAAGHFYWQMILAPSEDNLMTASVGRYDIIESCYSWHRRWLISETLESHTVPWLFFSVSSEYYFSLG